MASNVGLSPLLNRPSSQNTTSGTTDKRENDSLAEQFTIFKKPRLTIKNTTVKPNLAPNISYNGLSGSEKNENSEVPISSVTLKKLDSSKFKKLSRQPITTISASSNNTSSTKLTGQNSNRFDFFFKNS